MRVLLQVVQNASCSIDGEIYSKIDRGFLFFVGFNYQDNEEIMHKVIDKATSLRVFQDENGKTNLGLSDVGGSILCISQFTLYADVKKGRRPSFNTAARGEVSEPLYLKTLDYIASLGFDVKPGKFGADMKIALVNDGPTTIIIDSEDL